MVLFPFAFFFFKLDVLFYWSFGCHMFLPAVSVVTFVSHRLFLSLFFTTALSLDRTSLWCLRVAFRDQRCKTRTRVFGNLDRGQDWRQLSCSSVRILCKKTAVQQMWPWALSLFDDSHNMIGVQHERKTSAQMCTLPFCSGVHDIHYNRKCLSQSEGHDEDQLNASRRQRRCCCMENNLAISTLAADSADKRRWGKKMWLQQ